MVYVSTTSVAEPLLFVSHLAILKPNKLSAQPISNHTLSIPNPSLSIYPQCLLSYISILSALSTPHPIIPMSRHLLSILPYPPREGGGTISSPAEPLRPVSRARR